MIKTVLIIILSILAILFIFKAIMFSIKKTICYTENLAIRKRFKKLAIKILKDNLKAMKEAPFPIFIELHFNTKKYENYYVKEGLFKTIDFLFETVDNNLKEVEHMKGDSDIGIYKIDIELKDNE